MKAFLLADYEGDSYEVWVDDLLNVPRIGEELHYAKIEDGKIISFRGKVTNVIHSNIDEDDWEKIDKWHIVLYVDVEESEGFFDNSEECKTLEPM